VETPATDDEWARAEAVRALALLDTPPDERFDRITRTSRVAFGVPISYVSLLDEGRQWLLSCAGLPPGLSFDRADTVCSYVIAAGETLVVPDARVDPRLADNPAVTGPPHVVFYAGHPLRDPLTRHLVGTLCLMDVVPRDLDVAGRARLDDLAGWVEAELARTHLARMVERADLERARVERLSAERARLLDTLVEGVVAVDADGRVTSVNAAVEQLLGHPAGALLGARLHDVAHGSRTDGTVHPWSECVVRATLDDGRSRRAAGEVFLRADGRPVAMDAVVAPIVEHDEVVGAVLTLLDATERMEAERHRREVLSTVSHEMRTPLTSIRGAWSCCAPGRSGTSRTRRAACSASG
jgi:PAS domain S-box-containing protein